MKEYNVKKIKQITGLNDQEFFEIKKKLIKDDNKKKFTKEELDLFAFSKLYIELGETPLSIVNKFKNMNNNNKLILNDIHLLASKSIKKSIEVIGIVEVINSIGIGYNDKSLFESIDLRKVIKYIHKANTNLILMIDKKLESKNTEDLKEKFYDYLYNDDNSLFIDDTYYNEIGKKIEKIYKEVFKKNVEPYRLLFLEMLGDSRIELEGVDIKTVETYYYKEFDSEIQKTLMNYANDERSADLIVSIASLCLGKTNIDDIDFYNWKDCAPNLIKTIGKYYPVYREKDAVCVLDGIINGLISVENHRDEYIERCKAVKEIIKYYINIKEEELPV